MKCLILTVTIGNGHNAVAKCMAEELNSRGYDTKILDIYKGHKFINWELTDVGFSLGFMFPKTANKIVLKTKRTGKTPFASWNKTIKNELLAQINEFRPDVIISTHLAGRLFVREYQKFFTKPVKSVFFVTDFDITPSLNKTFDNDYIIIPYASFRQELLNNGFQTDKIKSFGIPVAKSFYEPITVKDARSRLEFELDSKKLTILMTGGMKGSGKLFKTLKKISSEPNFQIIFVSSKNTKLKNKVDKFLARKKPQAKIINCGFIKSIDDAMVCSDLVLGKAGGLTCLEAIEREKPLFLYGDVCYPEYQNTEFLVKRNCAVRVDPKDDLIEKIKKADLVSLKNNIKKLKMDQPAKKVADFVETLV